MKRLSASIDRIEGDIAVLLLGEGDRQVLWPKESLPTGAKEGKILKIMLEVDEEATEKATAEVAALLSELTDKKD